MLKVAQYRPKTNRDAADTLSNGVSRPVSVTATRTSSNGRRGSTTVQGAPPVPRMLPPVSTQSPHTVASLQTFKNRRKAIADHARPLNGVLDNSSTTASQAAFLQARIKSQEIEIGHLKKRLDTLLSTDKEGGVLSRLETLEKLNLASKLKPLSDKIDMLDAATSKAAKEHDDVANEVKRVNSALETVPDIEKDIVSLKDWKATQSSPITESQLKDMVLQQVETKISAAKTALKKEIKDTETQLGKRMDADRKDIGKEIASLSSKVGSSLDFKAVTENKVKEIESSNVVTNDKTDSLKQRFTELHDDCRKVLGQVQGFQGALARLADDQKKLNTSRDELATRIGALEQVNKNNPAIANTKKRLDNFDVDIKQLRQEAEQTNGLQTRIAALENANRPASTKTDKRLEQFDGNIKQLQQEAEKVNGLISKVIGVEKDTKLTLKKHLKLTEDLEGLRSRLSKLELLPAKMTEMQPPFQVSNMSEEARLSGVEADASSRSDGGVQVPTLPAHSDAVLEQIQSDISAMKQDIGSLFTDLDETDQNVHQQSIIIGGLNEELPSLFTQKFDPFKQQVEPQLERILGDVRDIKSQLGSKVETQTMDQQMDRFTLAVQSLQSQFDNITTDALHQQMVHWFVQHYPDARGLLQQFTSAQQAVDRHEEFIKQMYWIQSRSQDLTMLLNAASQIHTLLQSATEFQRLANHAKTAVDQTKEAGAELKQQATQMEVVQNAVKGLQTTVHTLKTSASASASLKTNAPSASEDVIKTLEQNFKGLRGRVEEFIVDEGRARNEMRAAAEKDHDQLRKDFDHVNDTFIKPNEQLFKVLSNMVRFLFDIQRNFEVMNQNLKIKVDLKWAEDLQALLEGVESPDDSSNSVDKGKGKK